MRQVKALLGCSGSEERRSGEEGGEGPPEGGPGSPSECPDGADAPTKASENGAGSSGSPNGGEKGAPQAPSSFYCPISMELMSEPVMVATGHTYDKECIERWLAQGHRTCPVTGQRLRHLELVPNFALRNAIQEWATAHGVKLRNDGNRVNAPIHYQDQRPRNILQKLEGHSEAVLALAVGDRNLVSGSYDTTVRFWDLEALRCVKKCEGHDDAVRVLAAANGKVFSGSYDGSIGVW
eukprot:evm.model.scf_479.6 EVM.evm.TU.scf_479.6   scf_479:33896-37924(+)